MAGPTPGACISPRYILSLTEKGVPGPQQLGLPCSKTEYRTEDQPGADLMSSSQSDEAAGGGWRYIASFSRDEHSQEALWEIRELYPTGDGNFGYTENAVSPCGETMDELRRDLTHMLADLDRQILDLTVDPPRLTTPDQLP